jgi:hypothetical protein
MPREVGDRSGQGTSLYNLAIANEGLGCYGQALESAETSPKIHDKIEDP